MLKASPKSTTNTTTGVAWDDSYATNKSAQNIRDMVAGSELNPFDAKINKPEPWEYDPSKPLYDNRNGGKNGIWFSKDGDRFIKNWSYTQGTRYGPTRSYGWNYVDTNKINPHTGQRHEIVAPEVSYNNDMFDSYFGKYLNSMG